MTVNPSRIITPPMVSPCADYLHTLRLALSMNVTEDQREAVDYALSLAIVMAERVARESRE